MGAYRLRMAKSLVIPSLPKPDLGSKDRRGSQQGDDNVYTGEPGLTIQSPHTSQKQG